jgi:hypothetical protein
MFFELVQDNLGRTKDNAQFPIDFANTADTNLGSDAPSDRYVATTLGQESLAVSDTLQSMITMDPS